MIVWLFVLYIYTPLISHIPCRFRCLYPPSLENARLLYSDGCCGCVYQDGAEEVRVQARDWKNRWENPWEKRMEMGKPWDIHRQIRKIHGKIHGKRGKRQNHRIITGLCHEKAATSRSD